MVWAHKHLVSAPKNQWRQKHILALENLLAARKPVWQQRVAARRNICCVQKHLACTYTHIPNTLYQSAPRRGLQKTNKNYPKLTNFRPGTRGRILHPTDSIDFDLHWGRPPATAHVYLWLWQLYFCTVQLPGGSCCELHFLVLGRNHAQHPSPL